MRSLAAALVVVVLAVGGALGLAVVTLAQDGKRWYRGNTHTHTLWSDGDGAPELVADWYKRHGYEFLVLSEHNVIAEGEKWVRIGTAKGDRITPEQLEGLAKVTSKVVLRERDGKREMRLRTLAELQASFEEPGRFVFIRGEEITDKVGERPVHHGAVNLARLVKPTGGKTVAECLELTARAVEDEARRSGRPVLLHLNHPNYHWGVTADEIAGVPGERFFEVYNGHRGVRNHGDAAHPSTEKIWDLVLARRLRSGGPPLYALATDDAHDYHEGTRGTSAPGRGWVHVRAATLTADAITRAMLAGDFYASSGVRLEDVASDRASLAVTIAAEPGVSYTTRFIGARRDGEAGVVLAETKERVARYAFDGSELYVRAVVVSSRKHPNGYAKDDLETAWVQPVTR